MGFVQKENNLPWSVYEYFLKSQMHTVSQSFIYHIYFHCKRNAQPQNALFFLWEYN